MKLKSDTLKIGGTFVVTSLLFIGYNLLTSEAGSTFGFAKSERISTVDAKKLQDEYLNFKPLRLRYEDPPGTAHFDKLEGFRFNAADLDEIIHHNKIVDATGHPVMPDEIIFYWGQKGTFKEGLFGSRKPVMHIIAAGVAGGALMIPASTADQADAQKSSLYDKADPCPGPGCPTKF